MASLVQLQVRFKQKNRKFVNLFGAGKHGMRFMRAFKKHDIRRLVILSVEINEGNILVEY